MVGPLVGAYPAPVAVTDGFTDRWEEGTLLILDGFHDFVPVLVEMAADLAAVDL